MLILCYNYKFSSLKNYKFWKFNLFYNIISIINLILLSNTKYYYSNTKIKYFSKKFKNPYFIDFFDFYKNLLTLTQIIKYKKKDIVLEF